MDKELSDEEVAEDFRRQIFESARRSSVFETVDHKSIKSWLEGNDDCLLKIAESVGAKGEEVNTLINDHKRMILHKIETNPDDPHIIVILERIVGLIEKSCAELQSPIHTGIAFGSDPRISLGAWQSKVPLTRSSIVSVGAFFIEFCSILSKAIAFSLPYQKIDNGMLVVSNDPKKVMEHIKSDSDVLRYWVKFIISYALFDRSVIAERRYVHPIQGATRMYFLDAMELFAIGHEYGHHLANHGVSEFGIIPSQEKLFEQEFEADFFARVISAHHGMKSEPPNIYAVSGAGAIVLLSVLEMVDRAKMINSLGHDQLPISSTHPKQSKRFLEFRKADQFLPKSFQAASYDSRQCFEVICEDLWELIRPIIFGVLGKKPT